MNLLDMLFGAMSTQSSVDSLSEKTGSSSSQITKLIKLALPVLIKYLTSNASSQNGVASLSEALTQHTSTDSMAQQIQNADLEDGDKILQHILGGNMQSVIGNLSQETGMEQPQVQSALDSLAPALLSGLSAATGQAQNQQADDGFDLSDLVGMFGGQQQQSSGGLLGSLLGGGQQSGGGLLGSLLGGGQQQPQQSSVDGSALLQALMTFMK